MTVDLREKIKNLEGQKREVPLADILKRNIKEIYVPELDGTVKIKHPSFREVLEIRKQAKNEEDLTMLMLWKMLSGADPSITLEDVERMPFDVAAAILRAALPFGSTATTST